MKKFLLGLLILWVALNSVSFPVFALPKPEKIDVQSTLKKENPKKVVTNETLFKIIVDIVAEDNKVPSSYKFISVRAKIQKGTQLYRTYQKAIYLDLIKNDWKILDLSGIATHKNLVQLLEKFFGKTVDGKVLVNGESLTYIPKHTLRYTDLVDFATGYFESEDANNLNSYPVANSYNFSILNDVFVRLKTEHIDHENFSDDLLLEWAIKGMAEATGDLPTVYFPPSEAKDFINDINGDLEWIGAYIDMIKPGELRIISPLVWSPAEKAGLKWGDYIKKIDNIAVTEKMSLSEAASKIRGSVGTTVQLEILRWSETLSFVIERDKVHIDLITSKTLENGDFYIQITSFWEGAASAFGKAMDTFAKSGKSKLIIDLRNNPGGQVNEVSEMLSYFVPKGEQTLTMKEGNFLYPYISQGVGSTPTPLNIVILINSGSASASEIMTLTLKDYFGDHVKTIGEKSYGKGSAQSYNPYQNGGALKYTTAKWFSGKTGISIDKIGISPDITIVQTKEEIIQGIDTVLDRAKNTF